MDVTLDRRYRHEFPDYVGRFSSVIAGLIPDARIRVYPDSAHGFLLQYPSEAGVDINAFLTASNEGASSNPCKW
jgi:hypothetical protein